MGSEESARARRVDWARVVIWGALFVLCAAALLWQWRVQRQGVREQRRSAAGELQVAIAAGERAVQTRPNDSGARLKLGSLLYNAGDMNGAVEHLLGAAGLDPTSFLAQLHLGYAYAQRGDAVQAEQRFRMAIKLDPRVPEAYVGLAGACYVQARPDEAMAALREAVSSCPQTATTHMRLAEEYYLCNRPVQAEQHYREALRLEPDNGLAHYGLGRTLFDVAQVKQAQTELEKAIALGLDEPAAYYYAGLTYLHSASTPENRQRAKEHFQHVLRLDPGVARAYDCLGQIAVREQDYEQARGYYGKAVEMAPDLPDAHHGLSVVYRHLGQAQEADAEMAAFRKLFDRERARERLYQAVDDRPRDAAARLALGRFQLEDGSYAGAATSLQAAEVLAPENAEVHRLLQELYTRTGRMTDAAQQERLLARLGAGSH